MSIALGRSLKDKIRGAEPIFGPWIGIPHPIVVELAARLDFDFLLVDGEHSPIDAHSLSALLPSADLHRKPVIFRPRWNGPSDIKTALDAGAVGVMIPMVDSAEEAREVVDACKYPPQGRRGIGPWRASDYYNDFDGHVRAANDATTVIVQIESAKALENVDAIAAVDGVDVLFAGPADLSASLGLTVGAFSEALVDALARIAGAARAAGKVAAI
ncbi:MAG: 4-hydroxy-2-oxovalerate aldolase, partial [Rhizobiaceae bacterium]|nr:4-hydroxy-2-oxovalerate aldolase [Rhizobiaceae bacterium]